MQYEWNIFKKAIKRSFLSAWEYKTDFYSSILIEIVFFATIFITVYAIFQFIPFLKGWSIGEILLFAIFTDVSTSLFWSSGFKNIIDLVISGEFNTIITKPVNPLFLTGIYEIGIPDLLFSIGGIIIIIGVAIYYSLNITFLSAFLGIVQFLVSLPVFGIPLIIISSLAFYLGDVNYLLWLYNSINQGFKDYPLTIMSKLVIVVFAFLSPAVLLCFTIPAMILLNKISWQWSLFFIGMTIIFDIILFILLKKFFYRALRRYEGFG